jgi:hypothetical protein
LNAIIAADKNLINGAKSFLAQLSIGAAQPYNPNAEVYTRALAYGVFH